MKRETSGFTLVELAIALLVVAIIGAISITGYRSIVRSTRAMQAVGDLYAVRAAAYLYYGDTSRWPADLGLAILPAELAGRLPSGFAFVRRHYRLDWDNWIGRPQRAGDPGATVLVGISVVTNDTKLLEAVESLLSNAYAVRTAPNRTTLRIIGPGGL